MKAANITSTLKLRVGLLYVLMIIIHNVQFTQARRNRPSEYESPAMTFIANEAVEWDNNIRKTKLVPDATPQS